MKKLILLSLSLVLFFSCSTDHVNDINNDQQKDFNILKSYNTPAGLLKDYTILQDKEGNFKLELNTLKPATLSYTTKKDGTILITIALSKNGNTAFKKNFGNKEAYIKYEFLQLDGTKKRRIPNGDIQP